jgi:hypothetical protein
LEQSVLLFNEEDQSSVGGFGRVNESGLEILIDKISECDKLQLGERVDMTY